jgi:integrase/recombinase XerD
LGAEAALPLEVEEYLTWLSAERGRARNTVAAYRRDLRAYVTWLSEHDRALDDVTEADLEAYLADRRRSGAAASSVARALVPVRSLHRFLVDEGMAGSDPSAGVEQPRVPKGIPKPLSEDQVTALIESVSGDDPLARRDRAILEVLYGTGLRISELVALSLSDLDLDGSMLRAFGKGSKERDVPIGRLARDALLRYLRPGGRPELEPNRWARRGDAEAVFLNQRGARLSRQGAWQIVRQRGERAGVGAHLSPHVLRHSCATHMLDHGADIRVVQELLGHASLSTTQIYTLVSTERIWSVYRSAHPRAAGRQPGRGRRPTGTVAEGPSE